MGRGSDLSRGGGAKVVDIGLETAVHPHEKTGGGGLGVLVSRGGGDPARGGEFEQIRCKLKSDGTDRRSPTLLECRGGKNEVVLLKLSQLGMMRLTALVSKEKGRE